jgi:hypothetical protein
MEKFINTDQGGLFIKIFMNYMQIVSIIMTFNIPIPTGSLYIIDSVGTPVETVLFSLDCYLAKLSDKENIPIEYMRLIWTFVIPVAYLLL